MNKLKSLQMQNIFQLLENLETDWISETQILCKIFHSLHQDMHERSPYLKIAKHQKKTKFEEMKSKILLEMSTSHAPVWQFLLRPFTSPLAGRKSHGYCTVTHIL